MLIYLAYDYDKLLQYQEEDIDSNGSRPKVIEAKVEQSLGNDDINKREGTEQKDKSPERNFLSDISNIRKASSLFRSSKPNKDEPAKANTNGITEEQSQHNNGQAKYPMEDLASMDIGQIEKIESTDEKSNGAQQSAVKRTNSCKSKGPAAAHGAIHRAFNKLKLFF